MLGRRVLLSLLAVLLVFQSIYMVAPAAVAASEPGGQLVSDDPANYTPHAVDGRIYSIVQVGNTMIAGGTFTEVRNQGSNTAIALSRLMSFNATTGQINTAFAPNPNGVVNVVLPTGDGETVFVGGTFTTIGGGAAKYLAKIRLSDGSLVTSFNGGSPAGQIKDLRLINGRLWVAGGFTHIAGVQQRGLATLNPSTGALDQHFRGVIDGQHRNGEGFTTVSKIDNDPAGTRLVAIGNFATLDGAANNQFLMLDLTGSSAVGAAYQTSFYASWCASVFDSYMRDLDVSPDGSFLVVSTTGAYGGSNGPCDTTARFDVAQTGSNIAPSWINYTGGDTTYAVEITPNAVYVGGHQRWQNNAFAGDRPGQGAVARPGIAALNPINGLPFSWNPTRSRGVGIFDFLSTSQGLWAVSDTERWGQGNEFHGRLALFPSSGGPSVPAVSTAPFPNDVYSAGALGTSGDPSVLYRVNAAGDTLGAATGIDWSADTGASPSPYGNEHNRASYSQVPTVDATVPAGTPAAVFSDEAWDGAGGTEMTWTFPVPAGTPLEVRIYLANRYTGTQAVGQRVFDVLIDGQVFLDDFDIVAAVGHDVGTMRSKQTVSDGSVDIVFGHVVENPLVNAIEIRRTDLPPTADTGSLAKRSFNGSVAGPNMAVDNGGLDWNLVRGAFMTNGYLYTALSDGSFVRRTYDGSTFGAPQTVAGQDELVVLQDWKNDIGRMTGMFFDSGRIYFTLSGAGSNTLYYRYFNVENGVVGAKRYVASTGVSGISFSEVRGMFLGGSHLYWAKPDGSLQRIDWAGGPASGAPVAGTALAVSGPAVDGQHWGARAMFTYQDANGNGAPQAPIAAFALVCDGMLCNVDASETTVAGATIASYQWSWGDGATTTGVTSAHEYAAELDGEGQPFQVTLLVTSSLGGTSSVTQAANPVAPNTLPIAAFDFVCDELVCTFDASGSSDPDADGSIVSYEWDFGDGATATGVAAEHTFATANSYQVTLKVTDNENGVTELTKTVGAVGAPTAEFSVVCDSLTCVFNASDSTAPGSSIVGYKWTFDGTVVETDQAATEHTFAATGSYPVTLEVRTSEGLTATNGPRSVEVTRVNQAPTAEFAVVCDQLACSFNAAGSSDPDGSIASYVWSFGDGTPEVSGAASEVTHTFGSAGDYTATLRVTDNDGASSELVTRPVSVSTAGVGLVGVQSSAGNRSSHATRVPSEVVAGDLLVMFVTLNGVSTPSAPAGWALAEETNGNAFSGRVWTKVATAADAGANVTVTTSGLLKSAMSIAAYRSSTGAVEVAAVAAAGPLNGAGSITVPQVQLGSGSLVVSYVGTKNSSAVDATLPTGLVSRSNVAGSGSGASYSVLSDTGQYLSGGAFGGGSVTFGSAVTRALSYTLALRAV